MDLENNKINNFNIDNDEISLKELIYKTKEWLFYLKTKWKIIFITTILGGLIGLTIAIYKKPTYSALLTFAMEDEKGGNNGGGGISSALGLASSLGIDLGSGGGGAFAASNLTELMKSRLIVEKVLLKPIQMNGKTIPLVEFYLQLMELRERWQNIPGLSKVDFVPNSSNLTRIQDSILSIIYKDLINKEKLIITQKDKKVSILSIEVTSENELFAKIFCENIAKETSDFYIQTKSKKARLNVEILQKQVDSVKNSLNQAISGVATEVDYVYNLNPSLNIKGASSKKRQIDVQANTSILTNLAVQLELAKITLRKETPLIQLIDTPILPLEKNKLGKFRTMVLGGIFAFFFIILYQSLLKVYKASLV